MDFCMWLTGANMPALADDLMLPNDHTAHPRIRGGGEEPSLRQLEGLAHVGDILVVEHGALPSAD
jgi:hypothetical protein